MCSRAIDKVSMVPYGTVLHTVVVVLALRILKSSRTSTRGTNFKVVAQLYDQVRLLFYLRTGNLK